jgi:dienelactone hydrolase
MSFQRVFFQILVFLSLTLLSFAETNTQPRIVDLKAADGTALKASYFPASKPGPAVLLLHQCNGQRKMWDPLAQALNSVGINVLTIDYRGFGESGGPRFDSLPQDQQQRIMMDAFAPDVEAAYQYLLAQPEVQRDKIGAGGASCGCNNAVQLARRHSEIKVLMMLSGGTNLDGRMFLQKSANIPVFTAAADDDGFGNLTLVMQWLFSLATNSASRFQRYATGGHGAEMFAPHPDLTPLIARWFSAVFSGNASVPQTNGSRLSDAQIKSLELMDQPGGANEVAKNLEEARKDNPKAQIFSEAITNIVGYEHMQRGDTQNAVDIMKLNVVAYPDSPNAYDSLSDAYLANGQKELALLNAKKTLELLANDTADSDVRRKGIRDSAEGKIRQLEAESAH